MMRSVRLTGHEKRTMRAAILRRVGIVRASGAHNTRMSILGLHLRHRVIVAGSLVGALLFGSTMSYAAEGALPGDILYPIKVSVNEPARVVLARTPEARAILETHFTEERLSEVEQLVMAGELKESMRGEIEDRLAGHISKGAENRAKIEGGDNVAVAEDIATEMEVTLRVHEKALKQLAKEENEDKKTEEKLLRIMALVEERADDLTHTREREEESASLREQRDTSDRADNKGDRERVEKKEKELVENLAAVASSTTGEASEMIARTLRFAEEKKMEGAQYKETGNYTQALKAFKEGERFAKEAERIKKLEKKLNISMRVASTSKSDGLPTREVNISTTISSSTERAEEKQGTSTSSNSKDIEQHKEDGGANTNTQNSSSTLKQEEKNEESNHGGVRAVDN